MKHITSRLLALLLTLAMIISMVPAVYAADEDVTIVENEQPTVEETIVENSTEDTTVEPAKAVEANFSEGETALTNYVTVNNGETRYTTLDEAIAAAEPVNGVITYEITGTIEATVETTNSWGMFQVVSAAQAANVSTVRFVKAADASTAEIRLVGGKVIIGSDITSVDVEYEDLTLSRVNGAYASDAGQGTVYYTTWLRSGGKVTYTNCTFPNGTHNNQYGSTAYAGCSFTNSTEGVYNLWIASDQKGEAEKTVVESCDFTGTRGIKAYSEGHETAGDIEMKDTTFSNLTEKAAIVVSTPTAIKMDNVAATDCSKGLLQKKLDYTSAGKDEAVIPAGSSVSGDFDLKAEDNVTSTEFNISAGTFTGETLNSDYLAPGATYDAATGTVTGGATTYVAKVGGTSYATLADALAAAVDGDTVTLLADVSEDVTINNNITLDLGGKTVTNTNAGKATLTVEAGATATVRNGSIVGGRSTTPSRITARRRLRTLSPPPATPARP